jgi:hypothetical protein
MIEVCTYFVTTCPLFLLLAYLLGNVGFSSNSILWITSSSFFQNVHDTLQQAFKQIRIYGMSHFKHFEISYMYTSLNLIIYINLMYVIYNEFYEVSNIFLLFIKEILVHCQTFQEQIGIIVI